MKNSLVDKVKSVGKKAWKIARVPIIAGGIYLLSTLNADGQNFKSSYKKHDKGAKFTEYKSTSNDVLEEKVFYNPATKKDEPFYIQHLTAEERELYEDDLDIGAMPSDELKSAPMIGVKSSDIKAIVGEEFYHFFPEERNKYVLDETHLKNLCIDQKILLANGIDPTTMSVSEANKKATELRGDNYIFTSTVSDYINAFTGNNLLTLANGEKYLVFTLPEDQQEQGKTDILLMRFTDQNNIIPEKNEENGKKNIAFYGTFYRGNLEVTEDGASVPGIIDAKTGLVGRLEYDESGKMIEKAQEAIEEKAHKERNLAFIVGANAWEGYMEGFAGVQYGPVSATLHYGQAEEERGEPITTDASPSTGRYGYGHEDKVDISSFGGSIGLHPFSHSRISPFAGVGVNKYNYTLKTTEEIRDSNDNLIKANTNSRTDSEITYDIFGGIDFGISENVSLGIQGTYDFNKQTPTVGANIKYRFK